MAIQTPSYYKNELASLTQTFNLSLEGIINSYANKKLNINSEPYFRDENNFDTTKADISQLQSSLYQDIETMQDKIINLNNTITKLNRENTKLTTKVNTLDNQDMAAHGELTDQKFVANQIYIQNIILLILIISTVGSYLVKNYKS